MYTPDRELNPPCCYEIDIETTECVLCKETIKIVEANEIGDSLEYLCDKCERRVDEMDDEEVNEFVDEHLTLFKDVFKEVIKKNNHLIKKNNEQK